MFQVYIIKINAAFNIPMKVIYMTSILMHIYGWYLAIAEISLKYNYNIGYIFLFEYKSTKVKDTIVAK